MDQDDLANAYADVVVHLVRLGGGAVPSRVLAAVAVVLGREDLLDDSLLTFGLDYDLDVQSHELDRGFTRAYDWGRLKLRDSMREIYLLGSEASLPLAPEHAAAAARAQELYALPRRDLTQQARPQVILWRHYHDCLKESLRRLERTDYAVEGPGARTRVSPLAA